MNTTGTDSKAVSTGRLCKLTYRMKPNTKEESVHPPDSDLRELSTDTMGTG